MVFVGCSDNDDNLSLDRNEVSMYVGDEIIIKASYGSENVSWKSDNDFIASVSDGLVKANKVGETNIIASADNDAYCKVTVLPKYNLYEEPYMEWGVTKDYIREKYGKPYFESKDAMTYKENFMGYMFKDGKLVSASVMISLNKAEELGLFIKERYYPFKVSGGSVIGFINANSTKDATVLGSISVYSSLYYLITYQKPNL